MAHQAAADRQHLLLAARQGARRLLAPFGEAREQAEDTIERGRLRGARTLQDGAHLEVLEHGQVGKHLPALGDMAHAGLADAMARPSRDVGAVEAHAAGGGSLDAMDGADQRALAGSVGAHDGHDFSGRDVDGDAGQGLGIAIVEVEAIDLEQRRTHAGSPSVASWPR